MATLRWRKSSASAAEGDCVEIADIPSGGKAIRDSKHLGTMPLRLTDAVWSAFRQAVRSGEL
nr:DUF397 domain-containing protein [Sphaerisporangium rubeum]